MKRFAHWLSTSVLTLRKSVPRVAFPFYFLLFTVSFAHAQGNDQDYSKFLHNSQRHASVTCSACHHRNDNSAQPIFPSHKDCTGCHLTQFTTPNVPLLSICHTKENGYDR